MHACTAVVRSPVARAALFAAAVRKSQVKTETKQRGVSAARVSIQKHRWNAISALKVQSAKCKVQVLDFRIEN